MKNYLLDFSCVSDCSSAHAYIAARLGFPSYYGANLDALYDALCDMGPSRFILRHISALTDADGGSGILAVFRDVCEGFYGKYKLIELDDDQ